MFMINWFGKHLVLMRVQKVNFCADPFAISDSVFELVSDVSEDSLSVSKCMADERS